MEQAQTKKMTHQEKVEFLQEAIQSGRILSGTVIRCDNDLNLVVRFAGDIIGRMDYGESEMPRGGEVKRMAVLSKVGKTIDFKVIDHKISDGKEMIKLSRRAVQEEYKKYIMDNYKEGDVLDGTVINCEAFGAFIDLGYGVVAFLPGDNISICRVATSKEFFKNGEKIKVVIRRMWSEDGSVKMVLSHKELLGTWEENAVNFNVGEVVIGIVRSINKHGTFIELSPNLSGLAQSKDGIEVGDSVSVYIQNIIPDTMKVKLYILGKAEDDYKRNTINYNEDVKHIDKWVYSTPGCSRVVMTDFNEPLPVKKEISKG